MLRYAKLIRACANPNSGTLPLEWGIFMPYNIIRYKENKCQFYITKICYFKSLKKCRKRFLTMTKRNKSKSLTRDFKICANKQSGTRGVEILPKINYC